ncbi:hypothetical protein [Streptomyces sp. NPDC052701]|uniref:hypothetical protein n=1 Tax=Streptomyces sp. NPDC052701 TaxID=3155533 RepID=UPI003428FE6B
MALTAPRPDSRVIGLAHYAARTVLESVPARHGTAFQQSVALGFVAAAGAPVARDAPAGRVTGALKADAADAHADGDPVAAGRVPARVTGRADAEPAAPGRRRNPPVE